MHNHGSQVQKYANVGKHGVNVCRRRQTMVERMHNHGSMGPGWIAIEQSTPTGQATAIPCGPDSMQFPRWIPWGPGLVGAAGRDSMHNHGSQGRHDAQPWTPRDLVGIPSSDQRRPGQHDAIPCGPKVRKTTITRKKPEAYFRRVSPK